MRIYRILTTAALLIVVAGLAAPAMAAGPYTEAALGALSWTAAQQQPDGSFPGFGGGSTADAVLAICAVGGDPHGFLNQGNSPLTYLEAHIDSLTGTAGGTAKTILAVTCAGHDPRGFAGVDLLAALEDTCDAAGGRCGTDLTGHALAMLALGATGRPISNEAVSWLRQAQTPEGGWAWSGDPSPGGADTNSTALAVQALVEAGIPPTDPTLQAALAYLHTQQNPDGGFPYAKPSPWGSDTDANSTAYVIQALVAVGEDLEGPAWTLTGHTPPDALLALQQPSGGLQWQAAIPGENAMATYQAVPAFMLRAFPLAHTTVSDTPALLPQTGAAMALPAALGGVGLGTTLLGWALRRRAAS